VGALSDCGGERVTGSALHVIAMPGWRQIVRRAGSTLLVVSLLPMTVFYLTMSLAGVRAAVLVTVGWYYAGLVLRAFRRKPVLGAAVLGAGLLTIRTITMFVTGSAFLYFLQPVAGTVATATAIAVTSLAGRPILDKLAHEFCPFPEELSSRLRRGRFFAHLSVVWSVTYLLNALGTVWLLTTSSIGGFLVLKSLLSPLLTGVAIGASYLLFRLAVRHERVHIAWGQPTAGLTLA
jgi:uncharacterized membrane protein